MMLLSCVVLAFVAFDAAVDVKVIGAGNDSCGTWRRERRENVILGYSQTGNWVYGYLRGIFDGLGMVGTNDPLNKLTSGDGRAAGDAINAWLDKHCTDHPLDGIYAASARLAEELVARPR
jgi:hypothetical protein